MNQIRIIAYIRKIEQQLEIQIPSNALANQIVKEAQQKLNNPPQKVNKLFLNGTAVDQSRTVQQLGIKQGTKIEIEFNYNTMISAQHNFFNLYQIGDIDLWNSPQTIKDRILRKYQIDKYGYTVNLFFNNNQLEGNKPLFQYGIQDQSIISYTVIATLLIKNFQNKNIFQIESEVTQTIGELHSQLTSKLNIDSNFELELDGDKLNDFSINLFSLRIKNKSTLDIKTNKLWKITIRKDDIEPVEKIFTVNPDVLVSVLEQQVKEAFYAEPSVKLHLKFKDQQLESQKKISACNLRPGIVLIIEEEMACPSKIQIHLIQKGDPQIQQVITIEINDLVRVLDNFFPKDQTTYIHNGRQLEKGKSFLDEQIQNKSQIYYEIIDVSDLRLVFINTATDERQILKLKSNETIHERIRNLLKYDQQMSPSTYCVVHKGQSIDNLDKKFGELPEIADDQIITYCSQKLIITIQFNQITRQLEVERELTFIELGYQVKKELNIENDIDILQGGQKVLLNHKIKINGTKFEVIEKPAQQFNQNVQIAQQQAQNGLQQLLAQQQFLQEPPQQPAIPPPQPPIEKEITIFLQPLQVDVDMKVDVTMTIGEILKELRIQSQLPPNQLLYCEIGGVGVDEDVQLNTFADLGVIQVEISPTLTVYFQNKLNNEKIETLIGFDDPLESKARQFHIDHHLFTWKNQVIDIKKSCQTLGIFNQDVIYFKPQSQIRQSDIQQVQFVKVTVEFQNQQSQKITTKPSKIIEEIKREIGLKDVSQPFYIKETEVIAHNHQKVGDLAKDGKLNLTEKNDFSNEIHLPGESEVIIPIQKPNPNQNQNEEQVPVIQKKEQELESSQPNQIHVPQEDNPNLKPNLDPKPEKQPAPVDIQNIEPKIEFPQQSIIKITIILSKGKIELQNVDSTSTVEGLKQLILRNHKAEITSFDSKVEQTSEFQLQFEKRYLKIHEYLYNIGLENKELKFIRIINLKVNQNSPKKIQWGKKCLVSYTWHSLKLKLYEDLKIPIEKIKLKCRNRFYEDTSTFADCDILDNEEIELIIQ